MKGKTLLAVILPFLVAFSMGASFAVSQAAGYEGWFGVGAPPPPQPASPRPPLEELEESLTLNEDQRERFHGFRTYCDRELCLCRNRIAEARADLGTAVLSEPADPERIEAARQELLRVYDECSEEMVDRLLALKDGLDTEQRKKLADAFFPGASPRCGGCRKGGCRGRCGQKSDGN
ncbi:MAG: periplasmic heavy metal sensor [Planctomycetota bacterium]|jgi:hypothetical protein